jgi:uncharacterized FAD-dependent dehydrogenase
MDISKIINNGKKKLTDNAPEVLIGMGLAGMLTSTIMAVKATPKAMDIIKEEEDYLNRDLTRAEKVKLTWKPYAPAAIGYCVSAALIIKANDVNNARSAMFAGAYKLSEKALLDYKDKVIETIGEEKEREISDKVIKDRYKTTAISRTQPASEIIYGTGQCLCHDPLSGRYFNADMDKIRRVENDLNYRLMKENMVSLNEFYTELGMECTEMGFKYGWNIDDGLIEVRFTSIITDDNKLCLVVSFARNPRLDFDQWA